MVTKRLEIKTVLIFEHFGYPQLKKDKPLKWTIRFLKTTHGDSLYFYFNKTIKVRGINDVHEAVHRHQSLINNTATLYCWALFIAFANADRLL